MPTSVVPTLRGVAALALAVCAGGGAATAAEGAGQAACNGRAQVQQGTLEGSVADGVCRFRAVPYAAPPVEGLRFRPPSAPETWSGVRDAATATNVVCPRTAANVTESYAGEQPGSDREDCLYLNVTTPSAAAAAPRPVIVFFHGGAFRSGSGFQEDFDGARLALAGDVVVVTVNSRLGALGYLELGDRVPELAGSGNNGLRDQIAALRWVRTNAAAFGGDPDNITAAGQSAGAISIAAMLAGNPQPLMRRAILQSGNGYLVRSAAQARGTAAEFLSGTDPAALATMPVAQLMALQGKLEGAHPVSGSFLFGPNVDGDLVPGPVNARLREGSAAGIDLLLGTTANEATFFALPRPVLTLVPALANPFFPKPLGSSLLQVTAAYSGGLSTLAGPLAPLRQRPLMRMLTDQLFRVPATRMADAQQGHGRTYMSRFDWRAPDTTDPSRAVGSTHVMDLAFWFGGLRTSWVPGAAPRGAADLAARRQLSDQMIGAWTSFARTGRPAPPAGLSWPAYETTDRETLIWNTKSTLASRPDETQRRSWGTFAFDNLTYNLPVG
ncbi:MAG: carboxylesterase family protein [Solirubrobacteraceae bacterium]|nr:carboxylesterase family protein [Solirubrobacteraceae bacterium]